VRRAVYPPDCASQERGAPRPRHPACTKSRLAAMAEGSHGVAAGATYEGSIPPPIILSTALTEGEPDARGSLARPWTSHSARPRRGACYPVPQPFRCGRGPRAPPGGERGVRPPQGRPPLDRRADSSASSTRTIRADARSRSAAWRRIRARSSRSTATSSGTPSRHSASTRSA
jgi:hypothetical protein